MRSGSRRPYRIWLMSAVLIVAWVHGCIGLYFWLRMKAFFKRAAPFLLAAAVLIPTLALLGFYQARTHRRRRQRRRRVARGESLARNRSARSPNSETLDHITDYFLIGYLGLIGLVLLAQRRARAARAPRRHDHPVLWQRQDGAGAEGPQRARGEPALQRAPCQRLRRPRPLLDLPHPHHRRLQRAARAVAARGLRAQPRRRRPIPSIRLACQLRPTDRPLLLPALHAAHDVGQRARAAVRTRIGQERYLVSMFVDMRGSTKLAEKRLPFDTVFIVNRFLGAVSQAVIECGGQPNQFVGDGSWRCSGSRSQSAEPPAARRSRRRRRSRPMSTN